MNYAQIKAAIVARAKRSDLAARIPEFVRLAESEYNRITGSGYDLASGADTAHNWLSDYAEDVYIFGGLKHLALETHDDALLAKYAPLYTLAREQAQYAEVRETGVLDETMETDVYTRVSGNILTGDA